MNVWVLMERGWSWDDGDQLVGIYADRPSDLAIARAHLVRYSRETCWKNGKPRRWKPTHKGAIPYDNYYSYKVTVRQ